VARSQSPARTQPADLPNRRNGASTVFRRLLRRREAASYLNLSPSALDLLRARGDLAPVPVPSLRHEGEAMRIPLYDIVDLDGLIERWKATRSAS
jgi:hypothetical protein